MLDRDGIPLRACRRLADAPDERWEGRLTLPGRSVETDVLVVNGPEGFVTVPRRCSHEGYDLALCPVGADGQIVCPSHGQAHSLRPDGCESWPARKAGDQFRIFPVQMEEAADREELEKLRLELANLRQANAALEAELLNSAETLDGLIETLHSQQEQLRRRTREIETLNGLMERAIDTMGELFLLLTPDGRVRRFNTLAQAALGLSVAPDYLEDFFTPADPEALEQEVRCNPGEGPLMAVIRARGGRYQAEVGLLPQGSDQARPYLVRASLLHSPAGKLEGAVVIAGDISELKDREHAARDNEAMFRLTAGAAQDAIVLINAEDRILFWNRAAEFIFGYSSADAVGQSLHRLIMGGSMPPGVAAGLGRFRDSGQGSVFGRIQELKAQTKDGRTLDVEVGVSAVAIKERWHAIGVMRDITQRKKSEAELRLHRDHLADLVSRQTHDLLQAKDAAEAASQAKSEFIANMSHELRTPMHAIMSFSRMGQEKAGQVGTDKIVRYFDNIHASGKRLTTLINDLLDLSKLDAGSMEIIPQRYDLLELTRKTISELQSLFVAKKIELRLSCEPELQNDPHAWFDPQRITQVLVNLLSNALRFSPQEGEIHVDFSRGALPAANGWPRPMLVVSIADQGPGIPEADLEAVFETFVQSSRTKTGAGGTGLGLSICRKIIELHQGRISAGNQLCGGAKLTFCLPREAMPGKESALAQLAL